MIFLTESELEHLTGYKKPKLQRQWLANNGYSFDVRADGRPIVSRAHYESRHSGKARGRRPSEPDFAALDALN